MATDEPLDAQYFYWLYKKIGTLESLNPARSLFQLATQLHQTPFKWSVPNDGNREADGKNLRNEFLKQLRITEGDLILQDWLELDCSMLEMLIALCDRMRYETNTTLGDWFWTLLNNLDILLYTDEIYTDGVSEVVDKTITKVIERKYNRNGHGGLFPLLHATHDQRDIEIWYQMNAYLLENSNFE